MTFPVRHPSFLPRSFSSSLNCLAGGTMITRVCAVLAGFLAVSFPSFGQQPQPLDPVMRSKYQRAVEEVYWQHRIWPAENSGAKPALGSVISGQQLQDRADDAPRLSNALEKYWNIH